MASSKEHRTAGRRSRAKQPPTRSQRSRPPRQAPHRRRHGSPRELSNGEVADMLREMALFYEMDEVAFKPQAFERAAGFIASSSDPVAGVYVDAGAVGLEKLPGVGAGIAQRIAELLETGHIAELDAMRQRTPVDLPALTRIEGIGAKTVKALYEQLGVRNVSDLRQAAESGRIRDIPRFGAKSEAKINAHLKLLDATAGRRPLESVLPLARLIEQRLAGIDGVTQAAAAGSVRRRKATVGDLDFIVAAQKAPPVIDFFVAMPEVAMVYARGPTKALVRLQNGMDADLRVVDPDSYGAALMYFTGSKDHNIVMRRIAQGKKLKLNEYGLFRGNEVLAAKTEQEVYAALGVPYIAPEERTGKDEISAKLRRRRGS